MLKFFSNKMKILEPILVILGSTGSGKSKLGIELAMKYNGEIINADAMQMYKGLDITTNKVTLSELNSCPHHMMSFIDASNFNYTIFNYKKQATDIIKQIHSRGRLPVIVGGTNYYIESLLWDFLLPSNATISLDNKKPETLEEATATDPIDLYNELKKIDPIRANQIHPNDVRKVKRALEVYKFSGKTMSSFLQQQHETISKNTKDNHDGSSDTKNGNSFNTKDNKTPSGVIQNETEQGIDKCKNADSVSVETLSEEEKNEIGPNNDGQGRPVRGRLQYQNILMIWIKSDQDVLDKRLDERVDDMLDRGLIQELQDFCSNNQLTVNKGMLQNIGLKEMLEYLKLENKNNPEAETALKKGLESMKLATRQYARRQVKWIRNRFLKKRGQENIPPMYAVDSSNVSLWNENVFEPASVIVDAFLKGEQPATKALHCRDAGEEDDNSTRKCDVCNMVFVSASQFVVHMNSRKHKKRLKKLKTPKKENPKLKCDEEDKSICN